MHPGVEDLLRPNSLPGVQVFGIEKSVEDLTGQRLALSEIAEVLPVFLISSRNLPKSASNLVNRSLDSGLLVGLVGSGLAVALAFCRGRSIRSSSGCLLYTSPSPRDGLLSRMPSSA